MVRYDCSLTIYRAFFHIACFMIALRSVVQLLLVNGFGAAVEGLPSSMFNSVLVEVRQARVRSH